MNQNVISGLTATLFLTTLGLPLASSANPATAVNQLAEAKLDQASNQPPAPQSIQGDVANKVSQQPSQATSKTSGATALKPSLTPDLKLTHAVVKLGEQQSQATNAATSEREVIAKVQAHDLAGRKAATLYVRNLPILTFTSSGKAATTRVKLGSRQLNPGITATAIASAKALEESSTADAPQAATSEPSAQSTSTAPTVLADAALSQSDPVLKAAAIAARINQLNREGVDAKTITVSWSAQAGKAAPQSERYAIKANKTLLAVIDASTVLSGSTRNLETDALQATNRLRRLLGNASPLSSVSGKPNGWSQAAVGSIRQRLSGLASWYGPGFHGNPSASGEAFNQNAMTAAHRTLPFGTQILVTNLDNGRSVVVRINDRGPFSGDRVIDLSTAAARVLGLIQSGVAPVRLDVLDNSARAVTASGK
ncbi:septal ring lytic transglycosylase RlpA family protein [Stenomitos frigidus]|uniref:Probable endolytic peptidoglycan transglycosylase RlpA n=1 Tax=Stenomitos frigidus ULC18 TaxID=2107698 RepID=A0A2T1DVU0_9CYAN|nr:septal ring lytic transglycosylase RlpA family protein [Stenomitos frigidus]PSB24551.1 septal ring lytic transglycosylase RlpA family protein [Stenomitos frigidus ULC18]